MPQHYDLPMRRLRCQMCEEERDFLEIRIEPHDRNPHAYIDAVCPICSHIAETIPRPHEPRDERA